MREGEKAYFMERTGENDVLKRENELERELS